MIVYNPEKLQDTYESIRVSAYTNKLSPEGVKLSLSLLVSQILLGILFELRAIRLQQGDKHADQKPATARTAA